MSTLNTTNIKHGSSGTNNIVLDPAGSATINNDLNVTGDISSTGDVQMASLNGGQLAGFRNKIINGACQIAQRSLSETGVTATSYNTCDRWLLALASLGTWTVTQSTDAPDGFSNSFKIECTTADASPATGDLLYIAQRFEGQDLQDLGYGTSGAKALTLSFWVKSNVTGTASLNFRQPGATDRQYSTTYTVNSANTWEHKTITIPGDTSGTIANDNENAFQIAWWLDSGSTYTGGTTQGWGTAVTTNRNSSNFQLGNAATNEFSITGAQLEVSPVATPFEYRPIGTELALCQRYFYKYEFAGSATTSKSLVFKTGGSASQNPLQVTYPVTMRATPTADLTNLVVRSSSGSGGTPTTRTATSLGRNVDMIYLGANDLPTNTTGVIDYSGSFTIDAEL